VTTAGARAVLFDLDGTLLDTAPDLVAALNHLRVAEGFEQAPVEDYRRYVSRGALGLIRAGLPDRGAETEARWRQRFLDYYADHLMKETALFSGVDRLLEALDRRAVPWAIVTNKPEFLTLPIVKALGWGARAGAVVCGDTLPVAKPDPAPVRLACELLGVAPGQALMVGDDTRDLEAGEAAGAIPVLAAYGYGAAEALDTNGPVAHQIHNAEELLALLHQGTTGG